MEYQKPLIYAIIVFTIGIATTLTASILFQGKVESWIDMSLSEKTKRVGILLQSKLTHYKTDYYGLTSIVANLDKSDPKLLEEIITNGSLSDVFEKPELLALVSKGVIKTMRIAEDQDKTEIRQALEKNLTTGQFKHFANISLNENRPIFFDSDYGNLGHHLVGLIPVSKENNTVLYSTLRYEEIFEDIDKGDLLRGVTNLSLEAYTQDSQENYVHDTSVNKEDLVYSLDVKEEEKSFTRKPEYHKTYQTTVYHEGGELKLVFTELKDLGLSPVLRRLPFAITTIGTIFSILMFGLVFITLIIFIEQHYIKNSTPKKQG